MQFKIGARGSGLSAAQTNDALLRIRKTIPDFSCSLSLFNTPGDRDKLSSLRDAPPDFFSRDLDDALLSGQIDLAIHSAKDLAYPIPRPGIDWFWLPWRADPRDCWVFPKGEKREVRRIGVSSDRREAFARKRFPQAELPPLRGTIEERIAQLDSGKFDALLMAVAALERLGLKDRIGEIITLSELPVPDGQGYLVVTFRKGDPKAIRLRDYFVKAVRFVGGGVGSAELCTLGGVRELERADVCLYDWLLDNSLLKFLPKNARAEAVGKRSGAHSSSQEEICARLCDLARRGLRVVRLKGGDPGVFGRLAEETSALDDLQIPYKVLPGVSALSAATTGTGLLLTRRGLSRGFAAMTPRAAGGQSAPVDKEVRAKLPIVFFMSAKRIRETAEQLLAEGQAPETPAAIVYDAGGDCERVVSGTLECIRADDAETAPGVLIVGEAAKGLYNRHGLLQGRRVLLTCSEELQETARAAVVDFGGVPISRPFIRLVPLESAKSAVARMGEFDCVVLTSPASARILLQTMEELRMDIRQLPDIAVCGPGCERVLCSRGITPVFMPKEYSAAGMALECSEELFGGKKILRFASSKMKRDIVAERLREIGAEVETVLLYNNETIAWPQLLPFDDVLFASSSAAEAFPLALLEGKRVAALGKPTAGTLAALGRPPDAISPDGTIAGAIASLAIF